MRSDHHRARPALRLAVGCALLLLTLVLEPGLGVLHSRSIDSASEVSFPADVTVVLPFEPERFHIERISEHGVYRGRGDSAHELRLSRVDRKSYRAMSRFLWVESLVVGSHG